jgi:DNA-binding IclR family transcriptional regulator
MVAQEPISGHYSIGPMAIALGLTGMRSLNVVRTANELMPKLRNDIDETVMLLIWGRSGPIVFGFEESSRPVFMNVRVGSILPMLTTAAGLLFAAHLPGSQTREIVEAERNKIAAGGSARPSESAWARRVEMVREVGLARSEGEFLPGVNAIAAPIFDHKGRIAAVIGALGRSEDIDVSTEGAVAAAVQRTAREASWRLGYLGDAAELRLPGPVD